MSRPVVITIVAVFVMSVSALSLFLVISAGMIVLLRTSGLGPFIPTGGMFGTVPRLLIFTCGGFWGIITGVGLLRARDWARISMLVVGGLLAFLGTAAIEVYLFLPLPGLTSISAREQEHFYDVTAIFFFFLATVGAWWFCLFNSGKMQKYFEGHILRTDLSPKTTAIGWFFLISGFLTFSFGLLRLPITLFGFILTGWSAFLVCMTISAAELHLGIGLLKLKTSSHSFAIYFLLFGLLNSVFFLLRPGRTGSAAVGISALPLLVRPPVGISPAFFIWLPLIIAVAGALLPVGFLASKTDGCLPPLLRRNAP